jgi:hypothetical protein
MNPDSLGDTAVWLEGIAESKIAPLPLWGSDHKSAKSNANR